MKTVLRWLVRLWFRFRVHGADVLGTPGPVLLVPNHVSWLDWLFLYVVLDDDWKFVAATVTAKHSWVHRKLVLGRRTFPIDPSSPYAVKAMAEFLEQGGRLVLFAEGRISATGGLMKLFEGTGFLIRRTHAKVITCYLRGANRVRWVRHGGWRRWFPRVSMHFSPVLTPPVEEGVSASVARQRLTRWLRDRMVAQQFEVEQAFGPRNVLAAIAETAGNLPGRVALEDATFTTLTYRRLMVGVRVLAAAWRRQLRPESESPCVGVLLPNVNATPVTVLSLWAAGRVPTILNFSSGVATMLGCARLAGLREIITSRAFVERARLDLPPFTQAGLKVIYLEDVRATLSRGRQLLTLAHEWLAPGAKLRRGSLAADATAVVLFTSGSENVPKGVELTHGNLLANMRQGLAVMDLTDQDRFFNALPLFHSFGLTAGTLLPLVRGCYTFLYPTPLHYRIVPAMVYERNCTVLLATNTFLNGYARKANPYDFRTVRYLMAGAEKVQATTLETWSRVFGLRVLEGYGATECSPILSVNTWLEPRVGSAGRLLPGIEYKLQPVEGVARGGRLFVRGPNVMKRYLNPEADAAFQALGGWYDTGDIAEVDAEGYVHLLGRLKRFAKVSGEMVSLTALEDALAGAFPQFGARCEVAILARPDANKGELLIAVTNDSRLTLAEVRATLRAKGFSNLAAPKELQVVHAIPKLGTGKVNHRQLAEAIGGKP
ncbi:AMP-binding protein [Opitutus sp. ER46]|uniref:AMP-binding protein n=1 Tax=Opitutus sp. ER46 TaxID=2161864 RepID=UPI000D327F38|nr:AMP-binding protein [Opitutus sp. ER46]PTX91372.1 AMP-dependent synthetase [Opitutus sp. ER46]